MRTPTRTWAWSFVGLAVACGIGQGWLLRARGVPLLSAAAVDEAFPVVTVAMVICTAMGAAILTRLPWHRIGWLLSLQAGVGVGLVAGQVAWVAVAPGSPLPSWVGAWAALTAKVFGVPWALGCLALVFLLVPDGRLLSRRWRLALWLVAASYGLTVVCLVLIGPVPAGADVTRRVPRWLLTAYDISQISIVLSLGPALASLLRRGRRASGLERRQLTWVLAGAAALVGATAIFLGYGMLPGPAGAGLVWVQLLFHAGYMAVPVCAGVAVFKYRLYDADRVVSRGIRLAAATILVTAGYVVAVAAVETAADAVVPQRWAGVGTSAAAFVVVVVALQPLQGWLRRFADRVVYGQRAAPYQVLAEAIRGMPGYGSPRDLLARIADTAAAAADGTATARLLLPGGGELTVAASSRDPGAPPPPAPSSADRQTWPIRQGKDEIGRLEVLPRAGGLNAEQRRLFAALAEEAGPAFYNARLQAELAARAEALVADTAALAESRRRLVRVGYAERDRLSATIQRDVLVHLGGLEEEVRRIRGMLPEHPDDAAEALAQARVAVNTALDELRALTREVYPAVLARRGLTAAIRSAISEGAVTQLETYGPVDQLPEPQATTAYFVTVDSLRDLAGGRRAVLAVQQGRLRIEVTGQPRPQPAWVGIRDRVEAVGGTVESAERQGLRRLVLSLPVDPPPSNPPPSNPPPDGAGPG